MNDPLRGGDLSAIEPLHTLLACPVCHGKINLDSFTCGSCGKKLNLVGNVVSSFENANISYFNDKHEIMTEGNSDPGTQKIFYARQSKLFQELIPADAVVLDVGCGPKIPYQRGPHWRLIGLEPSLESVVVNAALDLRLHGTSVAIPLSTQSVDAIVCFYSLHHMTNLTVSENREIVRKTFEEFGRVMRPGGQLMIFDLSPWWPFSQMELLAWNSARRFLGSKLDMFFWKADWLADLGKTIFPSARLEIQSFGSSPFIPFAPIFYVPRLKIPRMLYPFTINFYRWRF